MVRNSSEAHEFLLSLGASKRLIDHAKYVGEAAEQLLNHLEGEGVQVNILLVQLGAACHDAGKILYPNELDESGSLHEDAGEELLLKNGLPSEIARICRSHAQYMDMDVSYEELLVALADKLWKGKRVAELELLVVDSTAALMGVDRWDVFGSLDMCFEEIASDGDKRLAPSRQH